MNFETLDPIANLLGEWSTTLNTASIFFRIVLTVILRSNSWYGALK